MKVEIIKQTSINGTPAFVGDVVEMDPYTFNSVKGTGKFKIHEPQPQPENRDEELTKKRRTRRTKL